VGDVEHIQAVLDSSSRIEPMQTDLSALAEGDEPPPKAAFWILDRPKLDSSDEISLETVPRALCQMLLYGRQTDREAQLEVIGAPATYLEEVKSLLRSLGGDELGSDEEEEVVEQESVTEELLSRNWRMPEGATPENLRSLVHEYFDRALLETWPTHSLELLDDKTLEEAAREDAYRVRVLAAILVVQSWLERARIPFDFNRLRGQLGLPTLDPIDPSQTRVVELPLVRLARVKVDELDDDSLRSCFRRAAFFSAEKATETTGRELVKRPSMEAEPEYPAALALLVRLVEDTDEALGYVDQGRQAARDQGRSCAPWDLEELPIRFRRMESKEIEGLLEHVSRAHSREPGVSEAVLQFLMGIGAIGPDGTVRAPAEPAAEEGAKIVVPGEEAGGEAGKLWTPDGAQPSGEKPKIWTPD
jgi:hypothetical protein